MNKNELSAYMSALGKAGGKKLAAEKKKNDPDYYKRISLKYWAKRRKEKKDNPPVDKSK